MKLEKGTAGSFILTGTPQGITSGIAAREACTTDDKAPLPKIRRAEKRLMHRISALEEKNILFLKQVHGDTILPITSKPETNHPFYGDADAMITDIKRICLVIRTADCVPVFIYDKKNQTLGAIHSGWKGTQLDITGKTIDLMKEVYGSQSRDLMVWIYPSIGPESYEVNEDVARYFPNERIEKNGHIYVDLWKSIENSLLKRKIKSEHIYNTGICNRQNTKEFFSHRFGDEGRNLNFAFLV